MLDFFQWMTVISFLLSAYLSTSKIYNSLVRVDIENISIYKGSNIIYLQFIINNRSTEPIAITDAFLSQKQNDAFGKAAIYEKLVYYANHKSNGVTTSRTEIKSNGLPINITQKSASTILLSFPLGTHEIIKFTNDSAKIELKINGKYRSKTFEITSGNYLLEQLKKSATRWDIQSIPHLHQ